MLLRFNTYEWRVTISEVCSTEEHCFVDPCVYTQRFMNILSQLLTPNLIVFCNAQTLSAEKKLFQLRGSRRHTLTLLNHTHLHIHTTFADISYITTTCFITTIANTTTSQILCFAFWMHLYMDLENYPKHFTFNLVNCYTDE